MNRTICALLFLISWAYSVPAEQDSQSVHIGLVLSGGGALGLAHIGVLKVLEREGVPIYCISANSMGSIIGGLYAAGYTASQIESIAVTIDWKYMFSPSLSYGAQYLPELQKSHRYVFSMAHRKFVPSMPGGLISLQKVEFLLMRLLSKIEYDSYYDFDCLAIPLRIIAVDLVTGCRIILKDGRVEQAIRGSIAIPGVFAPEVLEDKKLVDGGVLQYFPVDAVFDMQPDFIIASLTTKPKGEQGVSMFAVISRATSMVGYADIEHQKQLADILIEPNLQQYEGTDYEKVKELIALGETAAETALPRIKAMLENRTPISGRRNIPDRRLPYVHAVKFEGLVLTNPKTITHGTRTKPGELLDFSVLLSDLEKYYESGLFNSVNYHLESVGEDTVDVIMELHEQDYGFYLFGIRYDNEDNATIGLEFGQSNIKGSGLCARAAINLGDPNEYRLGIANKNVAGFPFGYRLDAFWGSMDRSYYEDAEWQTDYNTDYLGAEFEVGRSLSRYSFFRAGFTGFYLDYRFPVFSALDSLPENEWIIGPVFHADVNLLDDLYMPTRGLRYRMEWLYSTRMLGATENFVKVSFSAEHFLPAFPWLIIRPGADYGVSLGRLSWFEYFCTGGEKLPGFKKETFTTDQKSIAHLGFDFRIGSILNSYPLYFQLLFNAAIFRRIDDIVKNGIRADEDIKLGAGTGLRTNTPVGPLQIIIGFGTDHRPAAEDNLHFNVFFSLGRDFRYTN